MKVEIDIKKLTEEAVNHMEGAEDLRWSVGMALQELYGDQFVYAMQVELGRKFLQHTGGKK
jgi:hypothetical protein